MKLNEILSKKIDYEIIDDDEWSFRTKATVGDRVIIVECLRKDNLDDNEWSVAFAEMDDEDNGTFTATGKGKEFEVFALVKDVLTEFVKKQKPDRIEFTASKENDKDNRGDLYERFLKRFKIPGYSYERMKGELRDRFYIEKD
jgi:hypothetical protein